jgi:peptidoglycan hydrolase-like protein with peptidoglycan-binding domain
MHGGGTQELSDNDMEAVEQALEDKGYDVGRVDGRADDVSRAAIRAFQKDEGIPITGMIDEKTADRLGFKEAHKTRPGDVTVETDRSAPLEQRSYRGK